MKNTTKTVVSFLGVAVVMLIFFCIPKSKEAENTTQWAMNDFVQIENQPPVIEQDSSSVFFCPAVEKKINWESERVLNPTAIVYNDSVVMLYRAEDNSGNEVGKRTSRIGYAISSNGISFEKEKEPVLFPDKDEQAEHEWLGGCEDPHISMAQDGTYFMFYTQWNRQYPRLAVAYSKDLKHWNKYGPVFRKAYNGKYYNIPSRSASIVTKLHNGKQTIEKINGKYYMYWGDNHIFGAVSDNLLDWYPLEDENGELKKIISPRNGYFDSNRLCCGPSAIQTEEGILFFYNGENKTGEFGSHSYPGLMVSGGQALFDKHEPDKLLERLDEPFIFPSNSSIGAHNRIFIQSLVYFNNEWYLYYDKGESTIQVSVYNMKDMSNDLPEGLASSTLNNLHQDTKLN